MEKFKRILALLLVLVMMFALCACGGAQEEVVAQTQEPSVADVADEQGNLTVAQADVGEEVFERKTAEGTLTVGLMGAAYDFDPATNSAYGDYLVYDTLFQWDVQTQEIVPMLAESYEYEGTNLRIKLREGVMFSNGEELTADDVLYSFRRFYEIGSIYSPYYDGWDLDASYAEDDYTVVLVADEVYAAGLSYLASRFACIVNQTWCENAESADWWDKPCGTGPYTVEANVDGSYSSFKARDDYWGEKPEYTDITIKYYSESTTMFVDYENGVTDVIYNIPSNDVDRIRNGEVAGTDCVLAVSNTLVYVILPEINEYFSDYNIRKAFAYGVDWEAVCEVGYGNLFEVADSCTTPLEYFQTETGRFEYDPELAKQALADAGYEAGEVVLDLVLVKSESAEKMAETIQAYLSQIGITLNVNALDLASAIPYFVAGESAFQLVESANPYLDCDYFYTTNGEGASNILSRNTDPDFNRYMLEGRVSEDYDTRAQAYQNAYQVMYDQIWWIPLCYQTIAIAQRDYVDTALQLDYSVPNMRNIHMK